MEEIIKDKSPKPAGLLPKNLQAFVLVGLALLMVLIMAVTGHKRPVAPASAALSTVPDPLPVNSDEVADFQKGIEQTQRESAPQAEAALLEQQRRLAAQSLQTSPYGVPVNAASANGSYPPGAYAAGSPASEQAVTDPIVDEKRKRHYMSLFADNVALSYRKDIPAAPSLASGAQAQTTAALTNSDPLQAQDQLLAQAGAQLAREEQLLQQMQQAAGGLSGFGTRAVAAPKNNDPPAATPRERSRNPDVPEPGTFNSFEGKKYVLFEGTILEALLINRLDGSFAGPISCLVSTNVYSHDRQHLLIPAGSKLLGEASKVDTFGQVRLAVAFHRLIMPDGFSVNLDQFKGLDQAGATALKDKVNNHYAKIFGESLALGFLGGVSQIGTGSVLTSSGTERIQQGFGAGLADAGEQILDRFLNILPTVTIREGTRVKVYFSNDLLLPEYSAHNMSPNL
jgi:type IV secretion system protein TrbI